MASEQTINKIATALGETGEIPLAQVQAVLEHLGEAVCLSILEETQATEKAGGMLRSDGTGKRTPGGVFFYLARQKLPKEVRSKIFNDKKTKEPKPPGSEAAPPRPPVNKPGPPASAGTRRRVFEVVPAAKPAAPHHYSPSHGRIEPRAPWPPAIPPGSFVPPEVAPAVVKAKARAAAQAALLALNPTDQYLLLAELLGELHAQFGGEVPKTEAPKSEGPPSVRPEVLAARVVVPLVAPAAPAAVPAPPAPAPPEPVVVEKVAKPKAARAPAARASAARSSKAAPASTKTPVIKAATSKAKAAPAAKAKARSR